LYFYFTFVYVLRLLCVVFQCKIDQTDRKYSGRDEKIIHQYRKTNKNTWPINKERDKQELKWTNTETKDEKQWLCQTQGWNRDSERICSFCSTYGSRRIIRQSPKSMSEMRVSCCIG